VEKSIKTLAPAKRYRIEFPEPFLVIIGIGAINKITHTGDYGDINFIGGGVGNFITRSGTFSSNDICTAN
jgi:hypothetical protein